MGSPRSAPSGGASTWCRRDADAAEASGNPSGNSSVNTDPAPAPTTLDPAAQQPGQPLEIDRPSPVPPYLRLVVPSACWNASKIIASFSPGIPIPVSRTANVTTERALSSEGTPWSVRGGARPTSSVTLPASVNLMALARRLRRICCSRWASVVINPGSSAAVSTRSSRPLSSAWTPNACSTTRTPRRADAGPNVHPAGLDLGEVEDVLDQCSSSDADARMVLANSVCFGVRFESRLSASNRDSNSSELSGAQLVAHVRQELDLYWLASASCCAFSSTRAVPRRSPCS